MNTIQLTEAISAMIACALWSSTDFDGNPLDSVGANVSQETLATLAADLRDFVEGNADDIAASGLSPEQVGHDFWLTRNRHGAGFWDRGLGEIGERLTWQCRPFGSVDLYIGDDGRIHA